MNEAFKKRQISFILKLGLLTLILAAVHIYIFQNLFSETKLFFSLWKIYVFHFITVLVIYSVINYKYSNGNKIIFNLFMGGTLLKMILAILFLLPMMLSAMESKKPDVFNFFIPYFIFLAFEVYNVNFFLSDNTEF